MGAVKIGRQPFGQQAQGGMVVHGYAVANLARLLVADELAQNVGVNRLAQGGQPGYFAFMLFGLEAAQLGDVGVEVAQGVEAVYLG
jgi:hypothetical protein